MVENNFVIDGYERAVSAIEPTIRAEVQAEYAEALGAAGFLLRLYVRWQIRQEIARRVERQAPVEGLY